MPTIRQLMTALKLVDDAIQNPLIREDLIQSAEVAQMGNVMDMIEQSLIVDQIRQWPKGEMKIPLKFEGRIYIYWNYEFDFLHFSQHKNTGDIAIGETDALSIDLSAAPEAVVAALSTQKERAKKSLEEKISEFDEKIGALLKDQAS